MAAKTDWFEEAAKRTEGQLRLVSWTIGTHNTTLGLAHPDCTVQNVYGDRLPHALCPCQPDVREYLKALCRDLATQYPLWGIQLEVFCWMGLAHGHHHERDLTGLSPLEQELMGLCFCTACRKEAAGADVDVEQVKALVKNILDAAFREAPQRPKDHPQTMAQLEDRSLELRKFRRWRQVCLASLIAGIKNSSLRGSACRLLLQTEFDPALADSADGFGCAAYQQSPSETLRICDRASLDLPEQWNGLLQCFVQLGMGVPQSEQQLYDIIAAVRDGGCNGINFYNRSEAPPKMLAWLAKTLPLFAT